MIDSRRPVYLTAGGRVGTRRTPDPLLQAVFRESGQVSPSIAYVGVANEDSKEFFNRMGTMLQESGSGKVTHAVITGGRGALRKAQDILESADIVFISGGDVERGMQLLEEKNMTGSLFQLYEKGKPFFGRSAGSIMLAKEWVRWTDPDDDSTAELFHCIGITPIICDTHDEHEGWSELQAALRLKLDNTNGYGIVSGTAIKVFPDGRVEALGGAVHQYLRKNGKVSRTADIIPTSKS